MRCPLCGGKQRKSLPPSTLPRESYRSCVERPGTASSQLSSAMRDTRYLSCVAAPKLGVQTTLRIWVRAFDVNWQRQESAINQNEAQTCIEPHLQPLPRPHRCCRPPAAAECSSAPELHGIPSFRPLHRAAGCCLCHASNHGAWQLWADPDCLCFNSMIDPPLLSHPHPGPPSCACSGVEKCAH